MKLPIIKTNSSEFSQFLYAIWLSPLLGVEKGTENKSLRSNLKKVIFKSLSHPIEYFDTIRI